MALASFLKEETPVNSEECPAHDKKPLDYYCLQCYEVICADCYIFGDHQGHKLSKKKELKDLNGFLISQLDKVFNNNKMFKVLKGFEDVESFLKMQVRERIEVIKQKAVLQFEVSEKLEGCIGLY